MDTALNQRQPFVMRQGHLNDLDDPPHEDCRDGDQPDAAYGRDPLHHKLTPADRISGGADRDRTGGLLVANQALSQLSYSPNRSSQFYPSSLQQNAGNQKTGNLTCWWAWIDLNYRPHPYQGC